MDNNIVMTTLAFNVVLNYWKITVYNSLRGLGTKGMDGTMCAVNFGHDENFKEDGLYDRPCACPESAYIIRVNPTAFLGQRK